MCENPNDPNFEFQFLRERQKSPQGNVPQCDVCGETIDLGTPESYHKVYWQTYGRDLYTHIACF